MVASTPTRQDNQIAASMRDDMKRVVKEALKPKKLILAIEEQQCKTCLFIAVILEKSLPRKFKMPQITPILARMILMIIFKTLSH